MNTRYRPLVAPQDRARVEAVIRIVTMITGVQPRDIEDASRTGRAVGWARRLALYLAYTGLGWPLERVGHAFGRNRSTVGVACRRVEDAREDGVFDDWLCQIEAVVRAVDGLPSRADIDQVGDAA